MHILLHQIRNLCKIKFLDLIEEASKEIKKKYKKIGILCTTKTKKDRLYDKHLDKIEIIYPSEKEQKEVSEIIIRIIRGKKNIKDKEYLIKLINNFINLGAEKVLLACTDLSNLIRNNKNTIDTTEILIKSIIRYMNSD